MFRFKISTLFIVLVLLTTACASQSTVAPQEPTAVPAQNESSMPTPTEKPAQAEPVTLKIGDSASITLHSLPAIAVKEGCDVKNGIKLDIQTFPSGAAMVESVAAGDIMVGQAGDTPFTSLAASGVPVKLIAQNTDSGANYTFWVKKELNPQSPKDLVGTTIGYPFGSTSASIMNQFIKVYGLDPNQIKTVDMSPNNVVAAYTSGDIDGFILWSPASNKAAAARPSIKIHDAYQSYFPSNAGPQRLGTAHTVVFAREEMLKDHPDVVQNYLRTLICADKFLSDPATGEQARQIIADSLQIDKSIVDDTKDQIIFQLNIDQPFLDDIKQVGDELYQAGKITTQPDVKAWTDTGPLSAVAPDLVKLGQSN